MVVWKKYLLGAYINVYTIQNESGVEVKRKQIL